MEVEQLEIFDFLKNTTPLEEATDDEVIELIKHINTHYQRRGNIINIDRENLYLIHQGAVSIEEDNEIFEVIAEKEWFGNNISLSIYPHLAKEDTIYYSINKKQFFKVLANKTIVNNFFTSRNISDNYQKSNTLLDESVISMTRALGVFFVDQDDSITNVAKIMTKEKTTAVLVQDKQEKLLGIITDRAFCEKVVAKNMDYNAKASSIMSKNPLVIEYYESGITAMLTMAKAGIRHLPIGKNNKIVGMLTAADLMRKQSHNLVLLLGEIKQATTVEDLAKVSKHLALILRSSIDNNINQHNIAYSLSTIGRSIVSQLISQYESKEGEPPVSYAFVVAGSLARAEQILHSDQDNFIILNNEYDKEKHNNYFYNLAKYVSDGLNECGYIYCPGDVMATNDKWRVNLDTWKVYFKKWITEPEPKSLMHASIFFDIKFIYGDKNLFNELQDTVLELSNKNTIFLSHMAANALQYRPPLGIFRNFLLDKNDLQAESLNMKKRGVVPIIDMVRVYAISNGVKKVNTISRIRKLVENKGLSSRGGKDLMEAYKFINTLRIKNQANQIKKGMNPNNYIDPIEISPLDKKYLKNVFKTVLDMQEAMQNSYQTGIL